MGTVHSVAAAGGEDLLVERFLARDPRTVEEVASLASRVVSFHGYSIPAGDRDDIVQEVILQVWEALHRSGRDACESLEALVRSVAYRRCIDWLRRRRQTVPLDPGAAGVSPGPDGELLRSERTLLARMVLEGLGGSCRELIRLHARENRSYREIAERLDRSEGALRTQMSACLKKARTVLDRLRRGTRPPGNRIRRT